MTGLLKAQLMEYEWKESETESKKNNTAGNNTVRSALEKIYDEIDSLAEFNRTTGLSQVETLNR